MKRSATPTVGPVCSGFTFLELVMVMLVAGIVAALAVPVTSGMLIRMNVRSTASGIKSACVVARARAMADPTTHAGVFVDTVSNHHLIFFDRDGDNEYISGTDSTYLSPSSFQGSVKVSVDSVLQKGIIFRGDGSAYRGGSLRVTGKKGSVNRTITISKVSGYVRVNL